MLKEPDSLLRDLDPSQRAAVTSDASPLAILAGAGSGKTRVLTRRIAWQAHTDRIDPVHTLAVTFTRKAAGELSRRLGALEVRSVSAGTIHSIALGQLRRHTAERGRTMPAVLERKARILGPLVGGRGPTARMAAAEIASEIEWAKARLIGADQYAVAVARAGRTPPRPPAEVASIYKSYEREKRSRGVVDFDDLLWWCADALEQDTEFAAAARWRVRHVFVDEFQDVSPAQLRLLRGWLGERNDLCVVGDPDQAIYTFAGADPSLLTDFARHFPGASSVRLECNYRSTPEVVAAGEALLADAGRPRPPRRAVRPSATAPIVTIYDTDDAEAAGIAERLRAAHAGGVAWSDLAVLYRTNAQSARFEEALTRSAIPLKVRGDGRFLERPEVRSALEALRSAAKAAPGRSFAEHIADLSPDEPGGEPGDDQTDDQTRERKDHLAALARLGSEYLNLEGEPGSIDGFVAYLGASLRGGGVDDTGDAVELLTFHRAKGLEFHTVFIAGLERGLVPISHADTPAERAEERRLLYVAITRAEEVLHLSYAVQRTLGLRVVPRVRSPWLEPIEAAGKPSTVSTRVADTPREGIAAARDRLAHARSQVDDDDASDPELLAALVEWRRNLARASGVPAYVIFNNVTLKAVASNKPIDRAALLDVPGIGPVKAERHGAAVLDLVRRHAS